MMLPTFLTKTTRLFVCAVIILNFFSCGPTIYPSHHMLYAPISVNSFFMSQKREAHAKGAYRKSFPDDHTDGGSGVDGADLSAAYAISDHVGVMIAHSTAKEKDKYNNNSSSLSYKRYSTEISAGYFTKFKKANRLGFEIYGGYGFGTNKIKSRSDITMPVGIYNNKMQRFFIQPGLVLHIADHFQMGFIVKTSFLRYHNIVTNYTTEELSAYTVSLYNADKHTYSFLEPSYTIQFPFSKKGWIRGVGQTGGVIKIGGPHSYRRTSFGSLGLIIDAHKIPFK